MAVVEIKAYTLQYLVVCEGYEDENGDYHQGDERWEGNIPCDAVPSGKAGERTFEDGVVRKYSFTVFLKPDCRHFTVGDKVRLYRLGEVYEYEVKGFIPYQHQCKMWIG